MRAVLLLAGFLASFQIGLIIQTDAAERSETLPKGFVYLRDIDPTIVQDMRYAGAFNFTGARVPGYGAAECVLLRKVAAALSAVQNALRVRNLALQVYDCYRPRRAVRAFVDWVKKPDAKDDDRHHPRTDRGSLVKLGYVSAVSSHSLGTAVDLTLIALPREIPRAEPSGRHGSCIAGRADRELDESLDMGTGFDCFDAKSRNPALLRPVQTEAMSDAASIARSAAPAAIPAAAPEASKGVTGQDAVVPPLDIDQDQRDRRLQLSEVMSLHGFKGIRAEWWHYQYMLILRPLQPQDFEIPPAKPR